MSVLARLYNWLDGTFVKADEIDGDFNQIVEMLNGSSVTKHWHSKFNHATDPVLILDQLGAGLIWQGKNTGSQLASVENDGNIKVGSLTGNPLLPIAAGHLTRKDYVDLIVLFGFVLNFYFPGAVSIGQKRRIFFPIQNGLIKIKEVKSIFQGVGSATTRFRSSLAGVSDMNLLSTDAINTVKHHQSVNVSVTSTSMTMTCVETSGNHEDVTLSLECSISFGEGT